MAESNKNANDLIEEVRAKALEEAKKQNLNEAQTKLYVETAIKEVTKEEVKETKAKEEVKETKAKETKTTKKEIKETTKKEAKYLVYTPVKMFNGEVAGVQFAYGKAEVKEGWILSWFKEHGYRVEEVSD